MMTARGSTIERRKGLVLGADGFIWKPFEFIDLGEEVRRFLASGVSGVLPRLSFRLRVFLIFSGLAAAMDTGLGLWLTPRWATPSPRRMRS